MTYEKHDADCCKVCQAMHTPLGPATEEDQAIYDSMAESYFEPEYGLRQKLAQIHDQLDPVDEWRDPIREAIEAIPEWTNVSDDLPPEYQTVLIGKAGAPGPILAFWTGKKWCIDVMREEFFPTHWMPLPALPSN